jgi:hypothetical protein
VIAPAKARRMNSGACKSRLEQPYLYLRLLAQRGGEAGLRGLSVRTVEESDLTPEELGRENKRSDDPSPLTAAR